MGRRRRQPHFAGDEMNSPRGLARLGRLILLKIEID